MDFNHVDDNTLPEKIKFLAIVPVPIFAVIKALFFCCKFLLRC